MASVPEVSVVMAVRDGERFVVEAVESALAQQGCMLEVVVVDDGSVDRTPELLASLAARDGRIVVETTENRGLAAALNRGIELARAPLIARLDADDVALPGRLVRQKEFLDARPRACVVGGAVRFIDGRGRAFAEWQYPVTDGEVRAQFPQSTPFAHSAVTMRRASFESVGGYRPAFTSALDLDLWLRLSERCELANLQEPVVEYRIHPAQMTVQHLERQTLEVVAARISARARASGSADPVEGSADLEAVLASAAATAVEARETFVESAVWLAKTVARAGEGRTAKRLFDEAAVKADGSPALAARVHRERAASHRERGRRVRARLETMRAARVERTPGG
jgi:hypothetical protein